MNKRTEAENSWPDVWPGAQLVHRLRAARKLIDCSSRCLNLISSSLSLSLSLSLVSGKMQARTSRAFQMSSRPATINRRPADHLQGASEDAAAIRKRRQPARRPVFAFELSRELAIVTPIARLGPAEQVDE